MIIEFSVKNFRSIRELQTVSFVATGLKSPEESIVVDKNNIAIEDDNRLLKTIGIYGPNASGKSNIIRALEYFIQAIRNEASSESRLSSLCDPFLYQENSYESESWFQMVLIVGGKKYRYGFTCKRNINPNLKEKDSKEIISSEWLYGTKEKNTREYFTRKGLEVQKGTLPNNEKIPELPYEHTLFLTHATAFDADGICSAVRVFFSTRTISNFTKGYEQFRWNSFIVLELEKKKEDFLDLLSSFNLKYNDVIIEKDPNKPNAVPSREKIFLSKSFRNSKNEIVDIKLNLRFNESAGTQKLFDIAGLLIRAFNMEVGGLVIIDEIDSNFHPALLMRLIELFNDPETNKSNNQLLFTSHDTNLMTPSKMRRDQFYFTEKSDDNSTRVYSLADLKGIRNDADFAKQYLAGFYGALPMLDRYLNKTEVQNGTLEP